MSHQGILGGICIIITFLGSELLSETPFNYHVQTKAWFLFLIINLYYVFNKQLSKITKNQTDES